MKLYRSLNDIGFNPKTVLTVGTFDGVHRAHQDILRTLQERARETAARSVVVTFEPHPRSVVGDGSTLKLLTTLDERLSLFQTFAVDNVLVLTFTKEFSELSFREFYSEYLLKHIGIAEVIEGYNHHFGKGRSGNSDTLFQLGNDYGFQVIVVPPVLEAEKPISSSRIRLALEEGDLESANSMLGFPYFLDGVVTEGDKRGRKLGYPTANLRLPKEKLIPKTGIYLSRVDVGNTQYYGVASVGKRPTFYTNGELLVEVHIFDFSDDIYGKPLRLSFLQRLRDEQKFDTVDELIEQMNKDKEMSKVLIQTFRVA